jgi:limonene-1,2-epoxide hydrolase
MDLDKQVTEFFSRWSASFEDLCDSFQEEFGPDMVWDQRPIPVIVGADDAVRALRRGRKRLGLETIDVEMVHLAVDGDVVHTQRIDTLRRADGSVLVAAPVAGVLTYRDGRLVHWREYFDLATLGSAMVLSSVRWGLGRITRRT